MSSIVMTPKRRFPNILQKISELSAEEVNVSQHGWELTVADDLEVVGMIAKKKLLLSNTNRKDVDLEQAFSNVLDEYLNRNGRAIFFRLFIVAYYTQRVKECLGPAELLMYDLSANNGKHSVILEFFAIEELVEVLDWLFWYVFVDGAEFGIPPTQYIIQQDTPYLTSIQVLADAIQDQVRA